MARQGTMFRITIISVVVLFILFYAIFNSRLILKGPSIEIYDLKDGQIIEGDGLIQINGTTKNISFISLNGRTIFVDEKNNFSQTLLLNNEINPIEIYAKDKFGKEVRKKMTLVYKKDESPVLPTSEELKEEMNNASTTLEEPIASSTES